MVVVLACLRRQLPMILEAIHSGLAGSSIGVFIKVSNPWRAKKLKPSLVNPPTKFAYKSE